MASNSFFFPFLFLFFLCTFAATEPCGKHRIHEGKTFASCIDLPSLGSSLHWNLHSSSHTILEIAFKQSSVDSNPRWISWAINPHSKSMVGSQAFVAFQRDDGIMMAYTSPITSYTTKLQKGDLSFHVNGVSSIVKGNDMIIFATLTLPASNGTTTVNHLWQEGPLVGNVPKIHRLSGPNMGSIGTIDFLSGKLVEGKTSSRWKIYHGCLCVLGWANLMPTGALIARHCKQGGLGNWSINTHIFFQCSSYLLGLAGGIIGVLLWIGAIGAGIGGGSLIHQYIGIVILCMGLIQGIIGYFRPNKEDKRRVYFNIFHYIVGYGTIGLSIANVFVGIHMGHLGIKKQLTIVYIVTISLVGILGLILEGISYWERRTKSSNTTVQHRRVDERETV